MILKTGEITKYDLDWSTAANLGWVLIAPYVILQLSHFDEVGSVGDVAFQQREWFYCDLLRVYSPLGPELQGESLRWGTAIIHRRVELPRRYSFVVNQVNWPLIKRVIAYGRKYSLRLCKATPTAAQLAAGYDS